jgi:hypothetical protein|tara:strand:- start:104 stop:592 length:489 start_codon:yes stop_codon:yes gene_type:complete
MERIKLTQGQYALVDDEDFDELNKYKWCAFWNKPTQSYYVVRKSRKSEGFKKQRLIFMHRQIMNVPVGLYTDHINHDTLDNRKENLRLCTASQNHGNRQLNKNNTSGYKGVSWHKRDKRWRTAIRIGGKKKHLGHFKTKEEAMEAYNESAKLFFGEFARLNN